MTGAAAVAFLGPQEIERALSPAAAADAITAALRRGIDFAADPPRTIDTVEHGQLLLMPSQSSQSVGLKTITVAPGNGDLGLPRIQGVYLHFDATTLRLVAILDGVALTNLRTPAVSMAAVASSLTRFDSPPDVLVFGAGPQALGHVTALAAALSDLGTVTHVVPDPDRVGDPGADVLATGDLEVRTRLRSAGVVVCATTAVEPLFAAGDVRDDAVVIAVGSHEPNARELPGELLGRATVVVEDVRTALREAGDVVLAIAAGQLSDTDLVPMQTVVRGDRVPEPSRAVVFKSTGMAWEDREIAESIVRRHSGVSHTPQASR